MADWQPSGEGEDLGPACCRLIAKSMEQGKLEMGDPEQPTVITFQRQGLSYQVSVLSCFIVVCVLTLTGDADADEETRLKSIDY